MSSTTTESLKKSADEAAVDEPNTKKAKVADGEDATSNGPVDVADNNNGTTANAKSGAENKNGSDGAKIDVSTNSSNNKTPSKAVNGSAEDNQGADYNEDDNEEDDENDDGDENGGAEGVFEPVIAKSLEQVENIQSEICNLNEKASEEILKVEQKFNKLRRPHFEKRNELLKAIPNFWLTSLANHPDIAPMIESAEDENCLQYLVNLDVEEFEDIKSGYKLKLHFTENPYITNQLIVKEFQVVSSEEVISASTPVEFKNTPQGKGLKQVVENSIAQYKRSRRPGLTQQSFFAWLIEPTDSGTDEIAEILKDQIWPNPLEFFFATPGDYENLGTDDESDDEDEEIDDEDEIDEEEEVIAGGLEPFSDEEIEGEEVDDEEDEEVE